MMLSKIKAIDFGSFMLANLRLEAASLNA